MAIKYLGIITSDCLLSLSHVKEFWATVEARMAELELTPEIAFARRQTGHPSHRSLRDQTLRAFAENWRQSQTVLDGALRGDADDTIQRKRGQGNRPNLLKNLVELIGIEPTAS